MAITSCKRSTIDGDALIYAGNRNVLMNNSVRSRTAQFKGFSVGGAKDINNFRENIENHFFPFPTDITYEGIFYDYFFDTGIQESCSKLLCASYVSAVSENPLSKDKEYFLSVGLNSGAEDKTFSRKKLNLVVVIDISGSMDSYFDRYHYDRPKAKKELFVEKELFLEKDLEEEDEFAKTKLQSASESVVALLDHLNPDDNLGIVLFDDSAHIGLSLKSVKDINMEHVKRQLLEMKSGGSTNMSAGILAAENMFNENLKIHSDQVENRIIILTDAQINTGDIDEYSLLNKMKINARKKIYTSFIGIGVDFNTELVEAVNKTPGANHYSVHSPSDFKKRMDKEFELMVNPLVFDLNMKIKSTGFKIKKVYGSPEADKATGEVMKVATLFPSQNKEGEIRGGIIVLQLEKKPNAKDNKIQIKLDYKDREQKKDSHSVDFELKSDSESYANTGIRKGILLIRYVKLIRNWILAEGMKPQYEKKEKDMVSIYRQNESLLDFSEEDLSKHLRNWHRTSSELSVSDEYKKLFMDFHSYFEKEMKELKDDTLDQELEILKLLANYKALPESDSVKISR